MYIFILAFFVAVGYITVINIKKDMRGGGINLRFVLIAGVWGLCFSFIIIPWQTPDEYTHLQMIGSEIKNESIADILLNDMSLDMNRIIFHNNEKVDITLFKEALSKKPEYSFIDCLPKGISIKSIKHLPATVGIMVGIILRLPTYWVLQLGELFALIFYIGVCNRALSIMPIKKEVLELIMLLPMSIQQAASINYDAVMLPLCFFLVAYILHLKFEATAVVNLKDIVYIIGMLLIIAIIKLPYIILGGMFFMIPLEKIEIKCGKNHTLHLKPCVKTKLIILVFAIIMAFFMLFVLRDNESIRCLMATVSEWQRTIYLLKMTLETFSEYLLVSTVGKFGWLDASLSLFYVCLLVAIVVVFSLSNVRVENENTNSTKFSLKDKLVLMLLFLALSYLVTIALVSHTFLVWQYGTDRVSEIYINYKEALYTIPYIGGLQGRYYIPALVLLLLSMPNVFEIKQSKYNKVICAVECLYILCTSQCVLVRYWIM